MYRILKKATTYLLMISLILIPFCTGAFAQTPFQAKESSGEAMVVDVAMVRPLGIISTALGTVVWIVGIPFSLLGGNTGASFDKMVAEPVSFTFARPLGDFK
ncbi:hypothetical protein ACFL9U_10995 [Thermodesulfobacteriota bacterium]